MNVLVAVLNWGLGHAARCVPVIQALLSKDCRVIIASDGEALQLLRLEFPALPYYQLPSYKIRYSRTAAGLPWQLLKQAPYLKKSIQREHQRVSEIVGKENIQIIISDNRYGAYHPHIRSVWLGHQLQLIMPRGWQWLSRPINALHRTLLRHFHEYWVPDEPGSKFSGALSLFDKPVRYTGLLSRFSAQLPPPEKVYPVMAVLSGPEPQRTILEEKLRNQLPLLPVRSLLVRGIQGSNLIRDLEGYDEVDFLSAKPLNRLLCHAEMIIARCGYSTIMDLAVIGRKALLIPTPGQPEQEYLAARIASNAWAMVQPQDELSVLQAWNNLRYAPVFPSEGQTPGLLKGLIFDIINQHEEVYT